jgi:hypothetical protein
MIRFKSSSEDLEGYILANHPHFRRMIENSLRSYGREGGIPIQDLVREAKKALARRDR